MQKVKLCSFTPGVFDQILSTVSTMNKCNNAFYIESFETQYWEKSPALLGSLLFNSFSTIITCMTAFLYPHHINMLFFLLHSFNMIIIFVLVSHNSKNNTRPIHLLETAKYTSRRIEIHNGLYKRWKRFPLGTRSEYRSALIPPLISLVRIDFVNSYVALSITFQGTKNTDFNILFILSFWWIGLGVFRSDSLI